MKKYLLILMISLFAFACKKEDADPSFNKDIIGKTYRTLSPLDNNMYEVLEFINSKEASLNYRYASNNDITEREVLRWEPTGNIGMAIIVYFKDFHTKQETATQGTVTDKGISFNGNTRFYGLYK